MSRPEESRPKYGSGAILRPTDSLRSDIDIVCYDGSVCCRRFDDDDYIYLGGTKDGTCSELKEVQA